MAEICQGERGDLWEEGESWGFPSSRAFDTLPGVEMTEDDEPKIYLLPNLMTAGNLLCGFLAILTIFQGMQADDMLMAKPFYQRAMLYIFGSCLFDLLDGRLARLGGKESPFGQEFDSLADMVSFGLAPAMLVSQAVLADLRLPDSFDPTGTRENGLTWAIAFIYLLCGGVRLARFNCLARSGNAGDEFRGIPIPMAAGFVASLTFIMISLADDSRTLGWGAYLLAAMILGISFLMVSDVRYPSFKKIDLKTQANIWTLVGFALLLGLVVKWTIYAPTVIFVVYLVLPLFRKRKTDVDD
jgi:CDP-diacylglycerol--serine O-phosphatidyltransferase